MGKMPMPLRKMQRLKEKATKLDAQEEATGQQAKIAANWCELVRLTSEVRG